MTVPYGKPGASQKILAHETAQRVRDFRIVTEPGAETRAGLVQQHFQPIDDDISALFRRL
jgi:hypothetical protein